jgi:acetoin utilization protein AcuB
VNRTTVGDFMTGAPCLIQRHETLATAHRTMREHRIRHLPVLEGLRLVGIVSDRDLHLVETLRDVDPALVRVDEAMTPDPYTVAPGASLLTVARSMAKSKHGSAVVVKGGRVVGIFTTTDALDALAALVRRPRALRKSSRVRRPGRVRRSVTQIGRRR